MKSFQEKFENQHTRRWYPSNSFEKRLAAIENSGWDAIEALEKLGYSFDDIVGFIKDEKLIRIEHYIPESICDHGVKPGYKRTFHKGHYEFNGCILSSYHVYVYL